MIKPKCIECCESYQISTVRLNLQYVTSVIRLNSYENVYDITHNRLREAVSRVSMYGIKCNQIRSNQILASFYIHLKQTCTCTHKYTLSLQVNLTPIRKHSWLPYLIDSTDNLVVVQRDHPVLQKKLLKKTRDVPILKFCQASQQLCSWYSQYQNFKLNKQNSKINHF